MSKAPHFLQITAIHQHFPFLTVFLTIKTSSQNILIMLLQILLKLHEHQGEHIMEKKAPVNDFVRFPVPRIIADLKQVMASFRCYDNFNVIATWIMTNFHCVCLWQRSLCSNLVLTLKNCIEPPLYASMAYVVVIWPSFLFDSFIILGNLRDFWGAKGLPPPLAKNFPYTYGFYIAL